MFRIPVAVAVPFFPTVYRDYPLGLAPFPPTVPFDRILCLIILLFWQPRDVLLECEEVLCPVPPALICSNDLTFPDSFEECIMDMLRLLAVVPAVLSREPYL